jgi:hypothetical protein
MTHLRLCNYDGLWVDAVTTLCHGGFDLFQEERKKKLRTLCGIRDWVVMTYRYLGACSAGQPGNSSNLTGYYEAFGRGPGPTLFVGRGGGGFILVGLFQPEHSAQIGRQIGVANDRVVVVHVVVHMVAY